MIEGEKGKPILRASTFAKIQNIPAFDNSLAIQYVAVAKVMKTKKREA